MLIVALLLASINGARWQRERVRGNHLQIRGITLAHIYILLIFLDADCADNR